MLGYVLTRLASLVFVLLAVSLITFFLMKAVPGGPFDKGERALPEPVRLAQEAKYGLDKPVVVQYFRYITNAVQGDFGVSFQRPQETVLSLIGRTWPVTIRIGIPTILLAYLLGGFLGIVAATRQNSPVDYVVTATATLGITVPNFVVANWLILFFSVRLGWLPTGGWGSWEHYILPVIAYSLAPMAIVARYTRVSMLEVMKSDYVRTARAKGLADRIVLWRHIFRNALIPMVTVLLPEIPNILTGSLFIESIFRIPGLGSYFVSSTITRDYPMITALVLLIAALWGITYFITDILYTLLDPRIRVAGGRRTGH